MTRLSPGALLIWALWTGGGVVMGLAFLLPALWFLVWIALVPWTLAAAAGRPRIWPPYIGGVIWVLAGIAWLWQVHPVVWALNAFYFALFVAPSSWAMSRARHGMGLPMWLLAPVAWSAGEVLRTEVSPFPTTFHHLGNLLAYCDHLRQVSEVVGVWGLGLLPMLAAGAIAELVLAWWRDGLPGLRARRAWAGALLALAAPALAYGYGAWRLRAADLSPGPVVALVQPAVPQEVKNQPEKRPEVILRHIEMTLSADLRDAALVVWPESAITLFLEREPPALRAVGGLTARTGLPLVIGAMGERVRGDGDIDPTNSAFLIGTTGRVEGRWDKRELVPLVETLIWIDRVPPLRRALGSRLNRALSFHPFLVPGEEGVAVQVPGQDWSLGVTICYGDVMPSLSRDLADAGADLIAVISNEAWFGPSHQDQHLAMARLRAVETRRPVVRATNTGLTAIIDPVGEVRSVLDRNEPGVLVGQTHRSGIGPPPAWLPLWFGRLLLAAGTLLLAATFLPRFRPPAPPVHDEEAKETASGADGESGGEAEPEDGTSSP